jgi:predicted enzyme related to lactoylglutathione lyase
MKNAIVWADIPVKDMARAKKFYADILGRPVEFMPGSEDKVAILPYDQEGGGVGADLVAGGPQVPNADGITVYLDGGDDLGELLARVEPAGGKVLMPKTSMGDVVGNIAFFLDSEGNRIGLHSRG